MTLVIILFALMAQFYYDYTDFEQQGHVPLDESIDETSEDDTPNATAPVKSALNDVSYDPNADAWNVKL